MGKLFVSFFFPGLEERGMKKIASAGGSMREKMEGSDDMIRNVRVAQPAVFPRLLRPHVPFLQFPFRRDLNLLFCSVACD